MTPSHIRLTLASAACAVLLFGPLCSAAQSQAQGGDNAGRNLTQQTQSEINIALPSFAPLVDRVVPAVVNISVELKEQTAAQDEGSSGDESASPHGVRHAPEHKKQYDRVRRV